MRKSLLSVFSVFLTLSVFAQDSTSIEEPTPGKFLFSGYVDTYYFGNFNRPPDRLNVGVNGGGRAFDQRAGQFGIGLVQGKATYTSQKIDAVFDLIFGPFADLGNYGNTISLLGGTNTSTSLAIKQAYVAWKVSPRITLTAGQFGTPIGYEVIDAPVNYNYSLSYLFNFGPFYHIGLKGQYNFSDKVALTLGIINNVDNIQDNNRAKGFLGQFFFSPAAGWNVYLNTIISNEANADSMGRTPSGNIIRFFDLTTTYQVTEKFYVGFNGVIASQKGEYQGRTVGPVSQPWNGFALYSNYAFIPKFGLGARFEHFNNSTGARALFAADGSGTTVNSFTLTGNFTAADGHLLLKPEFRIDAFDKNKFQTGTGELTKSQATLGMGAIFKF